MRRVVAHRLPPNARFAAFRRPERGRRRQAHESQIGGFPSQMPKRARVRDIFRARDLARSIARKRRVVVGIGISVDKATTSYSLHFFER